MLITSLCEKIVITELLYRNPVLIFNTSAFNPVAINAFAETISSNKEFSYHLSPLN
jgi:hypothetical protein